MNDSVSYPPPNIPNPYHRGDARNQWVGNNGNMGGQAVQQDFQRGNDGVGPADLARHGSNVSSNMHFGYSTSNNPSYPPSYQHSTDAFSGQTSPTFNNPQHPDPLALYAAHRHENPSPYGDILTNQQQAGGHQAFGNPPRDAQHVDMSVVPRVDRNLPASPARQPPIPEGSESQHHNYFPDNQPQLGFDPDVQAEAVLGHHNRNGSAADTAYVLTGLAGPNQDTNIPYNSEIEVDCDDPPPPPPPPPPLQKQPHPPRQNSVGPGGAELAAVRERARGISKRSRPGKRARKAAENWVENVKNNMEKIFKPKKFKTTTIQYTKNRQIGMCLICKLGGRKQACNYFGDDRVCDVCKEKYGELAAKFCFQFHQVEELELWCPADEATGSPRLSWPMRNLYMHFAIGPLASCRRLPLVAVDLQNTAFDNDQLARLVNNLRIGLVIDQTLDASENELVDRARFCVGLHFLIERYPDMVYYAKPGERELGRHLGQAFLHRIVCELSSRTKSLTDDSHKWLADHNRSRFGAALTVLAVLCGLCARQSTLELRGYPGTAVSSLRKRAENAIPCLLRFGNATYELTDGDYKGGASPGDFESYSRKVLQELVMSLEDEIHATHESDSPGQAPPFSCDWINNLNTAPTPLCRLRGKSQSPHPLEQFIRSTPSICEFLSCTNDPPFLPSPNVRDAQKNIIRTGVPDRADDDDDGEEEAAPRLLDKGKGRADNSVDVDIRADPGVDAEREEEEFQSSLRASRTTNTNVWDSSPGHLSRPSGSSGQSYYRYA